MSRFGAPSPSLRSDLSNVTAVGTATIQSLANADLLDGFGKIKTGLLPALSITSITVVPDAAGRLALSVQEGDLAKQTDNGSTWIYDGAAWVEITSASTLGNLTDVNLTTPAVGDVLRFIGGQWVNDAGLQTHINDSSIHFTTTAGLTDMDTATPADKDFLIYSTTSNKYESKGAVLRDLASMNLNLVTDGDILKYQSGDGKWHNIADTLNEKNDVNITGAVNGQLLEYQSGNWINATRTDGEVNTHSTSGGSYPLTLTKVGVNLPFRGLTPGTRIGIVQGSQELTISTTGEANTASSAGGTSLVKTKVGEDLPFKGLTAGSNITLTPGVNDITIAATGVGESNTSSSAGGTESLVLTKVGVDLPFKGLTAGTGVTLTPSGTDVTIAATGEANTGSNVGTGEGLVFKQKSGIDLQFKKIKQGTNITVTNGVDDITIDSSGGGGFDPDVNKIIIGLDAGTTNTSTNAVVIGKQAGTATAADNNVSVGIYPTTAQTGQLGGCVSIGEDSGRLNQGAFAVSVGRQCGLTTQGQQAVAVGPFAGQTTQGTLATAVGDTAGNVSQGTRAVAVGHRAGQTSQGTYAVAVGNQAGQTNQHANSVILNGTSAALNSDGTSRFYVKPVRNDVANTNMLGYDATTGEVSYRAGGGNPFDQDLNTTNDVTFNKITSLNHVLKDLGAGNEARIYLDGFNVLHHKMINGSAYRILNNQNGTVMEMDSLGRGSYRQSVSLGGGTLTGDNGHSLRVAAGSVSFEGSVFINSSSSGQESTSSTTWTLISSKRIKKNIATRDRDVFKRLMALRVVDYHYKYENDKCCKHVGLIAEELSSTGYADCIHVKSCFDYVDAKSGAKCCEKNVPMLNMDKINFDFIIAIQELYKMVRGVNFDLSRKETSPSSGVSQEVKILQLKVEELEEENIKLKLINMDIMTRLAAIETELGL